MASNLSAYLHQDPASIAQALARKWWMLLVRGVVAILFGLLTLVWPGITLFALIVLYGAFALADGIFALYAAFTGERHGVPTWWLVIGGLLGIAAGLITFFWPGMTALVLIMLIGAWALVRGVFEIIGAIQLQKELDHPWWLLLSGTLSIAFGFAVMIWPGAGALALLWVIGTYSIIFGIMMIGLSFQLRKNHSSQHDSTGALP